MNKDLWSGGMATVAIVLSVFALTVWALRLEDSHSCRVYSEATGRPTKYVSGQCYVNYHGEWFTREEMRSVRKGAN